MAGHRIAVSGWMLVVLAVTAAACGGSSADTSTTTTTTGLDFADLPTFPPPGSPGGTVVVENPCSVAVSVEVRVVDAGSPVPLPGEPPAAVLATIRPGRRYEVGYYYGETSGPRDIVVTAPEIDWTHRQPAVEDGSEVRVQIAASACP